MIGRQEAKEITQLSLAHLPAATYYVLVRERF